MILITTQDVILFLILGWFQWLSLILHCSQYFSCCWSIDLTFAFHLLWDVHSVDFFWRVTALTSLSIYHNIYWQRGIVIFFAEGNVLFSKKNWCHICKVQYVSFLCFCLFGVFRPTHFSLIWKHHQSRAANFDLCSALIEQWGFFSVPHLHTIRL